MNSDETCFTDELITLSKKIRKRVYDRKSYVPPLRQETRSHILSGFNGNAKNVCGQLAKSEKLI